MESLESYGAVAEEFSKGIRDEALWLKCWADCGGGEDRTKAVYIRRRARFIVAQWKREKRAAKPATWRNSPWLRPQAIFGTLGGCAVVFLVGLAVFGKPATPVSDVPVAMNGQPLAVTTPTPTPTPQGYSDLNVRSAINKAIDELLSRRCIVDPTAELQCYAYPVRTRINDSSSALDYNGMRAFLESVRRESGHAYYELAGPISLAPLAAPQNGLWMARFVAKRKSTAFAATSLEAYQIVLQPQDGTHPLRMEIDAIETNSSTSALN